MYLKSLDIQGFKSFPDKIHIEFSSGVTAIVGPNGSGKSNIVDAVRWVLGEQSVKNLRGGRMEDVIFGGTPRRKPLGFCEATLTVDNREHSLPVDYDQVAVTRRYYRSGESEFFINKKAVRLRDVRELLMDTGLGREGYSIIGQGRIDEILSAKSGDRREIFEEAAGITKFRYRKAEAERKLAGTEENLTRIRDIVAELAGQVAPLKVQAEQARQFLLLRDQLRGLEVSLWMDGLERLGENRRQAQVEFENAQRSAAARRRQLEQLYERVQQLTDQGRQKELEAEQARQQLRQLESGLAALQSRQAVTQANGENKRQNIAQLEGELEEQRQRLQQLRGQSQSQEEQLRQLEQQLDQLEQQNRRQLDRQSQTEQARSRAALELAAQQRQLDQLLERQRQLELERAALESGQIETDSQGQSLAEQLGQARQRLEQQRQGLARKEQQLAGLRAEEARQRQLAEELARQRQQARQEADRAAEQLAQARRRLEADQDRAALLESLEREYAGFSHTVRQVLQAADKGQLSGLRGPVSRLIAAEDRYAPAIEIALGAAVSQIVTQDEESAKRAIEFLKKRDLGRATFLPLTALRPRKTEWAPLEGQAGFIAMADRLVSRQPEYDRLVESLLGATAVVENIDSAIRLSRQFSYRYRIVTLDGQLINPSGAMTGGSLNKKGGMLSRANELRRLKQQEERQRQLIQQLEDQAEQTRRQASQKEEQQARGAEELRQAQDRLLTGETEHSQGQLLLESLAQALAELEQRQRQAEQRLLEFAQQRQEKDQALEGLGQQCRQQEQQAGQCRQRLEQIDRDLLEQQQQNQQLRQRIAGVESALEVQRQGSRQLAGLLESLHGQEKQKQDRIRQLKEESLELEDQLAQGEQQRRQQLAQAEEKQQEIQQITAQKLDIEGQRGKTDREAQQQNDGLMNLEREQLRLEAKKNQAELEEKQILDKMWEVYELTPSTAQAVRQPLESLGKARQQADRLRGQMKQLGPVNLAAVEEYQRVNQRYTFMEDQRQDLEQAKKDLEQVISRLTQDMRQIFGREFQKINQNFGQTFGQLFGGGTAGLELEDPEDLLSSGIEIHAELPGKSRRVLSLLSGGEKALTAIALYFAILKTRPTPFCILDEIEAALDDVNVLRYMDYLRTLCGQTQFILITHRRGAMEGADILYGAAMQEQGVTKLLQLRLNEAEQKIKTNQDRSE